MSYLLEKETWSFTEKTNSFLVLKSKDFFPLSFFLKDPLERGNLNNIVLNGSLCFTKIQVIQIQLSTLYEILGHGKKQSHKCKSIPGTQTLYVG